MKVLVGLGNPGPQYTDNRHNIGYKVVDALAEKEKIKFKKKFRINASLAIKNIGGEEVLLVKPRTFMNNCGFCVAKIIAGYKLGPQDILIIYDDADLPLGEVRYRKKGSSAGHRGVASIISELGTDEIGRIKIGINKPEEEELADYVLSDFLASEQENLAAVIAKAVLACRDWIKGN